MIKVGLYLENKNISDVDLSKPEEGNPGIGGTQYNFITMPYYFKKNIKNEIEFVWYANTIEKLPSEIDSVKVDTCIEAAKTATQQGCDILIWRPKTDDEGLEFINKMNFFDIDIVAWVHNTPGFKALNKMNDSSKLKRFVCVSQEQLDRLRDHNIFHKSTCIFNGFDPEKYIPDREIKKDDNTVTYVGSLVPAKGFHHLARVWPEIHREVPSAKLVVIGSGKLYNRNQSLGEWNIAEENYEKQWRSYLADENGNIDKSVEFKGTLGSEKISIMQNSNVGVVNPSGRTENCPGSAIEFQAAGTPVVSGAYRGLFDTVVDNKTGLLGKSDKELVNNIVYLLKNKDKAREYGDNGIEFIKKKFSHNRISQQWLSLFKDVFNGKPNKTHRIKQHPFNDNKLFREIWRYIKKYIPGMRKAPSFSEIKYKLKIY